MKEPIGDLYQQETKYSRETLKGEGLDWANMPPVYKHYSDPEALIELPIPTASGGRPLFETIQNRRSRRDFTKDALSLETLSQLLWAQQGVTGKAQDTLFRAAPSAGARYPVETYILVNRVSELEPGVYHLFIPQWQLEGIRLGHFGRQLASAALGQPIVDQCAAVFCYTAVVERCKWKYKERGYRYMYLDAGHIGQNLALAAQAMDLGCCMIGAFFDDEVNALLGVDGEHETILYLGCVGPVASMK